MAWARELPPGRRPHFFKIFFPCNSSKHLGIPTGFWRHIEPQTSGYVGLTGPSGNVWNVKLVRAADGGMSFQNGWEEFVADHALGIGDFLVFRYDGDMNFRVLVFDPTSCEKEGTFDVSPCHEVKIQVESQGRSHEGEDYVNKLIATDQETDTAFATDKTCARQNNLVVACQALSKKRKRSFKSHLEEGLRIVDSSLIANEVDLDCRSSGLDMLEPPVNMEPEIVQIPASLNKCGKDGWMDNGGVDCSQTPQEFSHNKPPSSGKCALHKESILGHSEHVACEMSLEPQSEQAKCRLQPEASRLKQNVKSKMDVGEASLPDKSQNLPMKHKRLAVRRSVRRKLTISCDSGAVKKRGYERSRCSVSLNSNNVKVKADRRIESRRRPVTEEEKAKAVKAAMLFRSKHPSCLCIMRDSYVYRGFFMYLPNSFTQYLPKNTTKMRLRGPDHKLCKVMYKYYDRGGALSGGWGEFSRAHNLEMDDVCVFELVKPDEIKVHIFRVVDEITPFLFNTRRRKKD